MRGKNVRRPEAGQGERPTVPVTAVLPAVVPYRRPPGHRLAAALAWPPSTARRLVTAVLLLVAAEMQVIARYGDGHLDRTPDLLLVLLAPLITAAAMAVLTALGRLIHRTAQLLGGIGRRDVSTEAVGMLAAMMLLPAAAVRLWAPDADITPVVDLALSVGGLVLITYVVASLEAVGRIRAVFALLLPGGAVVALLIVLSLLQSATDHLLRTL